MPGGGGTPKSAHLPSSSLRAWFQFSGGFVYLGFDHRERRQRLRRIFITSLFSLASPLRIVPPATTFVRFLECRLFQKPHCRQPTTPLPRVLHPQPYPSPRRRPLQSGNPARAFLSRSPARKFFSANCG